MGIQGLLPFLKDATHRVNVRKYSGYTVAVDTYCWIHRGAFGCAMQLAKGEQTDMYVRYCLKFINMLRAMEIKPILVFDGSRLPAKKTVEESRRERRELYSKKGRQFLREGKVSEARDCFTKSVNVTPQMALEVIKAARSLGVDCIVAPYEADAQLAFLAKSGIAQAVVTEDSDLVAFGCPRIIYKLDLNGNGLEIAATRLNQAMKMGDRFSLDKFRYMCIAAGCDYLASLPGIGLGKAKKLFQSANNPDLTHVLKRLPIHLKMKLTVPQEYIDGFHQANNTFLYQLAFDPIKRRLVPLQPYSDDVDKDSLTYAGPYYSSDLALQQALGNLDPNTKHHMCDFQPDYKKPYDKSVPRHMLSIWHKDYHPGPDFSEEGLAEVQRHVTQGKEVTLMVGGLKMDSQRRKRPRPDADEGTPTNDDLTSIYGTPNTKRHSAGGSLIVPETPESKNEEPRADSPQRRNPFSREGSRGGGSPKRVAGFGAEERVIKTLSRRNIFAKGRMSASSRLDMLRGNTVVTSRFFATKPDQKLQETTTDVEKGLEPDAVPFSQPSSLDESSDSVDETIDAEMTSATGSLNEKTSTEGPEGTGASVLNRLQRFQRSKSTPALPCSQSKPARLMALEDSTKESTRGGVDVSEGVNLELDSEAVQASSQESSKVLRMSTFTESTQSRTGAFSWSRRQTSVTSLEKHGKVRNFKSLSDFRRQTTRTKLERSSSQSQRQSVNNESSLEVMSQESCEVTLESQQSNLCIIDTHSLSLTQLSSQSCTEGNNSQGSESLSFHSETEVASLQIESLQTYSESMDFSRKTPPHSMEHLSTDVYSDTNRPLTGIINKQSVQEILPNPTSHLENVTDGNGHTQCKDKTLHDLKTKGADRVSTQQNTTASESELSTSPVGANSTQEDRGDGEGETVSPLEETVDLTSESDENSPPRAAEKQTGTGPVKKKRKQDSNPETTPLLPTFPKLKPGSAKLSQCKVSGLSRRQKTKQTPKAHEVKVGGTRQQTLFAFMKKSQERSKETNSTLPLSPSKQNIILDVTPEGDNNLCTKGIVRVQRNIFK